METKNLDIRESTFDDCILFAKWEQDPAVTEFFTIDEGRSYEDVVTEYVLYRKDSTKIQFTITLKPELRPIGRIFLSRIDRHYDSLDITRMYIADPGDRGKGYGEEALRRILEFAFINLHMERVSIDHFIKNTTADYLYKKTGFQDEGVMRSAGKKDGRYIDLKLKSITRAEYLDSDHTVD